MKGKYPLMMQTAELSCCILPAKLTHTPLQQTSEVNAAALGSTDPNEAIILEPHTSLGSFSPPTPPRESAWEHNWLYINAPRNFGQIPSSL